MANSPEGVPAAGGSGVIHAIERLTVLLLGCAIVASLIFLVLRGEPLTPSLAQPVKLLIALAAATVGAFIPGAALSVGYDFRGVALRGVGGAAFFLIAWFGSGKVPALGEAPAIISAVGIETIDLRSEDASSSPEYRNSTPVLVLPLGFTSSEAGSNVEVTNAEATLSYSDRSSIFKARYFTDLQSGSNTPWLPNLGSFMRPQAFKSGAGREVAFTPQRSQRNWEAFVRDIVASEASLLNISVNIQTKGQPVVLACKADIRSQAGNIAAWMKANGDQIPGRITLSCE
jgi:hypothetical protein